MKKSLNGFMLLTITGFTFFSCNQSKTEASEEKKSEQKRIEVNSTISGPIADYFIVNRAVIKVDTLDQSIVLVEIERTDKQLPFDPNDVDICDYDSVKTWRYCLSPDVLDENNLPHESIVYVDSNVRLNEIELDTKVDFWGYEYCAIDQYRYTIMHKDLTYHGSKRSQENYDLWDKGRDTFREKYYLSLNRLPKTHRIQLLCNFIKYDFRR